MEGYIRTAAGFFLPSYVSWFIYCCFYPFLFLIPLCYSQAPVSSLSPPPSPGTFPLIVWSHGLTGTGDEHAVLAAGLARRGFVVALPQHSDGSSSLADIEKDGAESRLFYQFVDFSKYDQSFRQKQTEHRSSEVDEARTLALSHPLLSKSLSSSNVIVAGFSFGAATAALSAATEPKNYRAAILIDGWYRIKFDSLKPPVDIRLPLQAHALGLSLPSLFVGSAQFRDGDINLATVELQGKSPKAEVHVLEGSKHGNFSDAVWWLPGAVLRRMGVVGKADPMGTYVNFFELVVDFAERHAAPREE